ncbi:shikimate dehydrogenase [Ramlibacter sp. G-1-2-2]|uniref:Shikimate dehydrogenase n=1 Tax=Ramlibacter agri TaxID=2728837 RepID=A0A848H2X9_9BURK|nr:ThiF family adenylyltransferase [Ramlibacter agri]NML44062.1 shikimate dehydrogenase [Ramlibacter agri]
MTVPSISGRTRLFPIVGNPVAQVRAPAVFNRLFALAGIDAVSFGLALPPQSVAATCEALLASPSVGGLLVTVPYKKTLRAICARVGSEGELTGAVNALRRDADGAIHGDLFDGAGFLAGLRAAGHEPAGQRVLLLGAGGAGSAIASALAQAGVAQLSIYDPQQASAAQLAAHMRAAFGQVRFEAVTSVSGDGFAIVINASPLGLKPADAMPIDPAQLAPGTLVCDIIMEPATTKLLQAARGRGLPTHAGRAMLDYQLPAYLRFFGFDDLAQRVRIAGDEITLAPSAT